MKKGMALILTICTLCALMPTVSHAKNESFTAPISLMSAEDSLPSGFDARNNGWVTSVKKQGNVACEAFAAISVIESYNISQGFDDIKADYSETHLAWFYNTMDSVLGDGRTVEEPLSARISHPFAGLSKWSGIALEKDFPQRDDLSGYDEADMHNTGSGFVLKSAEILGSDDSVKQWIMQYGSVQVSFGINTASFDLCKDDFGGKYYNPDAVTRFCRNYKESTADHAAAIIGWDDSFPTTEILRAYYENTCGLSKVEYMSLMPPADGAWLCKDNGCYTWLSYYDPTLCEFTGYTTLSADKYRENYTFNGSDWAESLTVNSATSIANVFKADEYEILSAVAAYTLSADQPLNISIYTDIKPGYIDPAQGTLASLFSVTLKNSGYHIVELPQEIALNPNTSFSVVVEYEPVNGYVVFPVERNSDYGQSNGWSYSGNPDESYIYNSYWSSSWLSTQSWNNTLRNVFVQAFTKCNHQPVNEKTDATCEKDGLDYTACSQCSKVLKNDVISATGHSYTSVVTEPDCTNKGYTTYTCSVCEDSYTDNEVDATGHSHKSEITLNPTCTDEGTRTYTCGCGDTYTESVAATGHSEGLWVYEKGDKYTKICTVCTKPIESKIVTVTILSGGSPVTSLDILNQSSASISSSVTDNMSDRVIYASSDENIVTVDANGNIAAKNIGSAIITATVDGTSICAQCEVNVVPRRFALTWVIESEIITQFAEEGSQIICPVSPEKEGCKFIGWNNIPPSIMPSSDLEFVAVFEALFYCSDCGDEILGRDNIEAHIKAEAAMKATVEIANNKGAKTINYGETLLLTALSASVPETVDVYWYVDGVKCGKGETFRLKFDGGTKTVEVKLEDDEGNILTNANGEETADSQTVTVKVNFWLKIVSFFKNLFRLSRLVEQSVGF